MVCTIPGFGNRGSWPIVRAARRIGRVLRVEAGKVFATAEGGLRLNEGQVVASRASKQGLILR